MMLTMDTVGRYRFVRRLGSGAFATVWLGNDDALEVPVAIKVLADNWADNQDVRNRFLGEARLMRRIRDPRLVRVYDIGVLPDGRPYFVMDYCDGGSLADVRRSPGTPERSIRLCAEASRALGVLHRNNVVHRDVTPGNLLIDHDEAGNEKVMLADLGVAKQLIDLQQATLTAGTPAYMSPEQADGSRLDRRADIYAMACVTYAVLTGNSPFPARTLNDVLNRDRYARPEPIADRVGAPPLLDRLLVDALDSDPDRRPASAEIMADALDQIAAEMRQTEYRVGPGWSSESAGRIPPAPWSPPRPVPAPGPESRNSMTPSSHHPARWAPGPATPGWATPSSAPPSSTTPSSARPSSTTPRSATSPTGRPPVRHAGTGWPTSYVDDVAYGRGPARWAPVPRETDWTRLALLAAFAALLVFGVILIGVAALG